MNIVQKTCAAIVALTMGAMPMSASARCLNRTDMHALQAASLQQRLMVAAFTCHDTAAYNRFVLSHRGELQKSDSSLLAFFKKNGGTAAYHTYKTHLANASALESSRSDNFCGDADSLFQTTSGRGSLDDILDRMPASDTGYAACYVADAKPVRGEGQKIARTADSATPASSAPSREDRRYGERRIARSHWDRDDGSDSEDFDGPYREPPRNRYAERGDHPYGWDRRNAYDDRDEDDWRDGPAYDDGSYDGDGPGW